MKYIIAVDGGGSKTHVTLYDFFGNCYFDKIGKGCNYHSLGGSNFQKIIKNLFYEAKESLNLDDNDIELIYLGLSGADLKSDFELLNESCKRIFNKIKFTIVNDAWIIMRSGLETPYGAVAIAGTGTNSAAINKQGERAILRSLGYTLGIYGGGLDIAREALHYAFRSDELTYDKTILESEIPKLFNKKNMDEIVSLFYPKNIVDRVKFGEITALVNKCAILGDKVSQDILIKTGNYIGLQTAGVIKQLKMENEKFPVVIGGRVFDSDSPLLLSEFTRSLKEICSAAYIVRPKYTPVIGAYLSALDELNIQINDKIIKNLKGK
ncbi:MAG: ATPase [Candidatus Izimaplasma sp.]|nr:ATPase [Candidatus Izimaplasma bacterium]